MGAGLPCAHGVTRHARRYTPVPALHLGVRRAHTKCECLVQLHWVARR